MADISAFIERLKSNKLAIPALAVGAIVGGYVLLKNGGLGGGSSSPTDLSIVPNTPDATGGGSGGGGSTDTSGMTDAAIADLQNQQQSFAQSLVDQFNALTASVQSALSGQQSATQDAFNQLANQQAQAQTTQQAQTQPQMATTIPDFSQLLSAFQSSSSQKQAAYKSPEMPLAQGKLSAQSTLMKIVGARKNPATLTKVTSARPLSTKSMQTNAPKVKLNVGISPAKNRITPVKTVVRTPAKTPKKPTFSNGVKRPIG